MEKDSKICVAGSGSVVGQAICTTLIESGFYNITKLSRTLLDLARQAAVEELFRRERFEYVFLIAGYARGVNDNKKNPSDNFLNNVNMQNNVLSCCYTYNVKKIIFFSSVSALPARTEKATLSEDDLMTGGLAPSLEPYALAKLCGTKLCSYYNSELKAVHFVSLMPCYIYGGMKKTSFMYAMFDDFHRAILEERENVLVWGAPNDPYQLLHFNDVANAAILLMNTHTNHDSYIVCSDEVFTKRHIVETIKKLTGYTGGISFDVNKKVPGSYAHLAKAGRIRECGWSQQVSLEDGLRMMYEEYKKTKNASVITNI